MPLRTLADEQGREWQIWEVHPTGLRDLQNTLAATNDDAPLDAGRRTLFRLPATMRSGWLAFRCDDDARRLAPIPAGWESMPDQALIALLTSATPARTRSG
jgi:hypothetical protein